jgi:hypothetical protein
MPLWIRGIRTATSDKRLGLTSVVAGIVSAEGAAHIQMRAFIKRLI